MFQIKKLLFKDPNTNYNKTLMQEIKENTNKWKEISGSLVEIINAIKCL